jgi:hypothetical protein
MQMLHPFAGSIQHYLNQIADPDRHRPDHCPQCGAKRPLTGHGFYDRTLVDVTFNGVIRVRRYLCCFCKRTVSLLPEFILPWVRFSISVIALFLAARLLNGLTLVAAARAAGQTAMPYQRGQFWIRRFQKKAPALSLALVPLEAFPPSPGAMSIWSATLTSTRALHRSTLRLWQNGTKTPISGIVLSRKPTMTVRHIN